MSFLVKIVFSFATVPTRLPAEVTVLVEAAEVVLVALVVAAEVVVLAVAVLQAPVAVKPL